MAGNGQHGHGDRLCATGHGIQRTATQGAVTGPRSGAGAKTEVSGGASPSALEAADAEFFFMLTRSLQRRLVAHHSRISLFLANGPLHTSAPRLKKKRSKTDLFDGFEDRGADLFESEKVEKTLWTSDEVVEEVRTYDSEADKSFDDLLDSMVPRLGRNPRVPKPLRKGALINLIELAHTKEHLALVVKALAMYRESRTLATVVEETNAADAFIARCIKLDAKDSLLEVMTNRPKFGINLTEQRLLRIFKFLSTSPSAGDPLAVLETAIYLLPVFHNAYPYSKLLPTQRPRVCAAILRMVLKLPPEMHKEAEDAISVLLEQVQLAPSITEDVAENSESKNLMQGVVKEIEQAKKEGRLNISLQPSIVSHLEQKFGNTLSLQ